MNEQSQQTRKRERGQSTAEFVLVLPALLLFFFLMVDFGWMLKNWIVITNTAREAARCAVVDNCSLDGNPVTPQELACDRLLAGITSNLVLDGDPDPDVWGAYVTMNWIDGNGDDDVGAGDSVEVLIRGNNDYISPVMPFLSMVTGNTDVLPDPLPIRAREEMLLEREPSYAFGDLECVKP